MRTIRFFILILCVAAFTGLHGQDTVRMMHYNLLYFGNTFGCTEAQNPTAAKLGYLRIITQYAQPDILTVNELCSSTTFADQILNNSLNVYGTTSWQRATMTNTSSSPSPIVNMLYYNSDKLTLYSQEIVEDNLSGGELVRATDLYTLYYNDPGLATGNDTVFLTVCTFHLHSSDLSERYNQTAAYMDRLDQLGPANYLLSGDFNIDGHTEAAFQNLINYTTPSLNFYDPVNSLAWWHNTPGYASIHTQSTRLTNTGSGCFAGGGMDDRFDFILSSSDAMNGYQGVWYVPGTYTVLGQDGTFYNQEMPPSGNALVPDSVATSLYGMSDHLPVLADFQIGPDVTGIDEYNESVNLYAVTSLTADDILIRSFTNERVTLSVFNMEGELVYTETQMAEIGDLITIKASAFREGLYLVSLASESRIETHKVLMVR